MIPSEEEVNFCRQCRRWGTLVKKVMFWFGNVSERIKCTACGHIY